MQCPFITILYPQIDTHLFSPSYRSLENIMNGTLKRASWYHRWRYHRGRRFLPMYPVPKRVRKCLVREREIRERKWNEWDNVCFCRLPNCSLIIKCIYVGFDFIDSFIHPSDRNLMCRTPSQSNRTTNNKIDWFDSIYTEHYSSSLGSWNETSITAVACSLARSFDRIEWFLFQRTCIPTLLSMACEDVRAKTWLECTSVYRISTVSHAAYGSWRLLAFASSFAFCHCWGVLYGRRPSYFLFEFNFDTMMNTT